MKELLTKSELRARLEEGEELCDILMLEEGQECQIFKADEFKVGDEVIYIPDLALNGIVRFMDDKRTNFEYADDVIDNAYTGQDFVDECDGNVEMAERLFWYCDWQHPSSAFPEIDFEEEDE